MTNTAISRLNKKYDVVIFNQVKFSGAYKMSFDILTNFGMGSVIVKRNETMSQVIEYLLEKMEHELEIELKKINKA
jgi:hypothetical protein